MTMFPNKQSKKMLQISYGLLKGHVPNSLGKYINFLPVCSSFYLYLLDSSSTMNNNGYYLDPRTMYKFCTSISYL